jgi:hypothetical protein
MLSLDLINHHAMKTYSSTILKLGTRWNWVVSIRPLQLYHGETVPGTHFIGGWTGPTAGLDVMAKRKNSYTCWESTPIPRSSLYRLSYPGSLSLYCKYIYKFLLAVTLSNITQVFSRCVRGKHSWADRKIFPECRKVLCNWILSHEVKNCFGNPTSQLGNRRVPKWDASGGSSYTDIENQALINQIPGTSKLLPINLQCNKHSVKPAYK